MPKAKTLSPLPHDRSALMRPESDIVEIFHTAFNRQIAEVQAALARAEKFHKSEEADAVGGAEEAVSGILGAVDFTFTTAESEQLDTVMQWVTDDSARRVFAQVGLGMGDAILTAEESPSREVLSGEIFDQINQRAVAYTKTQVAELITGISDATRDEVRQTIAAGLESRARIADISKTLAETYTFSPERAALIGETEIANANSQGALAGLAQAASIGVKVKKSWLTAQRLERLCDRCNANEAAGPIDLDDAFPSGDLAPTAHPRCRCVLVPVIDDDTTKLNDAAGGEMANRYETPEDRAFKTTFPKQFGVSAVERELDEASSEFRSKQVTARDRALGKNLTDDQLRDAKLKRYLTAMDRMFEFVKREVEIQKARLAPTTPTKRIAKCH